MKKVLIINSSARIHNSKSRMLTDAFTAHWKNFHNNPIINVRELRDSDVPHINEDWITAAFKPGATRSASEIDVLKKSDNYISELHEADVIVLGTPMYNWSIPSTLKAYIDNILRVNETWEFNPANLQHPYTGLLKNKTLFLLLSRGNRGYQEGEFNQHMDFQSIYLKTVFNIIGITKIHMITIDGTSNPEIVDNAFKIAQQELRNLIEMELADTSTI